MADIQDSKRAFIEAGGNLQHKNVRRILADADAQAYTESLKASEPPNPKAAQRIKSALSAFSVSFVTIVMVIGTALLLIAVPSAEFLAVYTGLSVVTSPTIAGVTTFALFVALIVLLFLKHIYADGLRDKNVYGSIRYGASYIGRYLGIDEWRWYNRLFRLDVLHEFTKLERDYLALTSALNFAKLSIVGASFIGRLNGLFENYGSLPVGQALQAVQNNITGQELMGALVSVIVLLTLIRMLDVGVLVVFIAFKNTAGSLDLGEAERVDSQTLYESLRETYQSERLQEMTMQLQAKQQEGLET